MLARTLIIAASFSACIAQARTFSFSCLNEAEQISIQNGVIHTTTNNQPYVVWDLLAGSFDFSFGDASGHAEITNDSLVNYGGIFDHFLGFQLFTSSPITEITRTYAGDTIKLNDGREVSATCSFEEIGT